MPDKQVFNVDVENCNCIKCANISLQKGALNIKFAPNGTGKTTIAKAILYHCTNNVKELKDLAPLDDKKATPKISGVDEKTRVMVFDDKYAAQFQLIKNSGDSYQVFLDDEQGRMLQAEAAQLLEELHQGIQSDPQIAKLIDFLTQFPKITLSPSGELRAASWSQHAQEGYGLFVDPPAVLHPFDTYYTRDADTTARWAQWRHDGTGLIQQDMQFACPFCASTVQTHDYEQQNQAFDGEYSQDALEIVGKVIQHLKNGYECNWVSKEKYDAFIDLIACKDNRKGLLDTIKDMCHQKNYLLDALNAAIGFNIQDEQMDETTISAVENKLKELLIDCQHCTLYQTDLTGLTIKVANDRINKLMGKSDALKRNYEQYHQHISSLIGGKQQDINHFLTVAGFPYEFYIEPAGNYTAQAKLKTNGQEVKQPDKHLSWGERNAFALVMFMFEAHRNDADLIILDDPIASFDKYKKFAVIKRLFDQDEDVSFNNITTMLLTHDLQPVIDYRRASMNSIINMDVRAHYLYSKEAGVLEELEIGKNDLVNSMRAAECAAKDVNAEIPMRVVCARKYLEYNNENAKNGMDWQLLSCLIHHDEKPIAGGRTTPEPRYFKHDKINEGERKLQALLGSGEGGFDYNRWYAQCGDKQLVQLIANAQNDYEKIVYIRFWIEAHPERLDTLRTQYSGLAKYLNESHHVDDDYLYELNPKKFPTVPKNYLQILVEFIGR